MNPINFSGNFRASYIFAGAFLKYYLENKPKPNQALALQKIAQAGSLAKLFSSNNERSKFLAKFSSWLKEPVAGYAILWARRNFGTSGILTADCSKAQVITQINSEENLLQDYIKQKSFYEALDIIKKIDINNLNLSARRKLVIRTELLINNNNQELLDIMQDFLAATKLDQRDLGIKFAYALGQYTGPDILAFRMAKYLYARILMKANNYQDALLFLDNLSLPEIILDEALAMKAECLLKLKKYSEASEIFSNLLTRNLSPGAYLLYSDKLDRIKFKERIIYDE